MDSHGARLDRRTGSRRLTPCPLPFASVSPPVPCLAAGLWAPCGMPRSLVISSIFSNNIAEAGAASIRRGRQPPRGAPAGGGDGLGGRNHHPDPRAGARSPPERSYARDNAPPLCRRDGRLGPDAKRRHCTPHAYRLAQSTLDQLRIPLLSPLLLRSSSALGASAPSPPSPRGSSGSRRRSGSSPSPSSQSRYV